MSHYGADMTRYVIDAPTLLHLVATKVQISPSHQLVAPNLIRSQRSPCFSKPFSAATSRRLWHFSTTSGSPS